MSMLARDESRDGRIELLELRRLLARCSLGSVGLRPVDLANKLRMSVSVTTPVRRPERWEPGNADPGTDVEE
ncbi:hypothetical protein RRF57_001202 [Xylaria bambusicola]|uniref:EF-hand domain-containing protein n=1 Tax=Xylaria bambusicola TaxID=326684 RepID=A0AAN7UGY8_9PEZI